MCPRPPERHTWSVTQRTSKPLWPYRSTRAGSDSSPSLHVLCAWSSQSSGCFELLILPFHRHAGRQPLRRAVVEGAREGATTEQLPLERRFVYCELVCVELSSRPVMARDDAAHGLLGRHGSRRADLDGVSDSKLIPVADRGEVDRARLHLEQLAGLSNPGKTEHVRAAEATEQDRGERLPLQLISPLVDVEDQAPRRACFVVVVGVDERGLEPVEPDVAGPALVDEPRQRAEADAVRRPTAQPSAD